jgi:hypothetical protein
MHAHRPSTQHHCRLPYPITAITPTAKEHSHGLAGVRTCAHGSGATAVGTTNHLNRRDVMNDELILVPLGDVTVETRQAPGDEVFDEIYGRGAKPLD